MSVLYLHFESPEREGRAQKLGKSGAHVVTLEPRWPGFFEQAKKLKPYAIAIDFSYAPSHALETADYLSKARETKDVAIYVLRVPEDRHDAVQKRLPNAAFVTEPELGERLAVAEKEAVRKALEKKEAAAAARKIAREKKKAEQPGYVPKAAAKAAKPAKPSKAAKATAPKKPARKAAPHKKKPTPKKKKSAKKKQPEEKVGRFEAGGRVLPPSTRSVRLGRCRSFVGINAVPASGAAMGASDSVTHPPSQLARSPKRIPSGIGGLTGL